MRIVILSENSSANTMSLSEWGFSAFIEHKYGNILFDTGMSGDVVIKNAKVLNVDLTSVETIILSHGHYDHCNGLDKVVEQVGKCTIYSHSHLFQPKYTLKGKDELYAGVSFTKERIEGLGGKFVFVDQSTQLDDCAYIITNVPAVNEFETISDSFKCRVGNSLVKDCFTDEVNLAIVMDQAVLTISGCAHRGVVNIIEESRKVTGRKVSHFIGGTHLKDAEKNRVKKTVEYFLDKNFSMLAPAHCTGFDALVEIKNALGDVVRPAFCGTIFNL